MVQPLLFFLKVPNKRQYSSTRRLSFLKVLSKIQYGSTHKDLSENFDQNTRCSTHIVFFEYLDKRQNGSTHIAL